jgi:hypothetical protein
MSIDKNRAAIEHSARRLWIAVLAVMILIGTTMIVLWIGSRGSFVQVTIHDGATIADPRLTGTLVFGLIELALFQLLRMLGRISAGELFSVGVIRHFRGFAFWLMIVALVGVFGRMIATAISGPGLTPGQPHIALALDLRNVLTLGITLLLFLLARLLERARQIDEENREIV